MLHLGKQGRALCTPGERALAGGQVVVMLSYWEAGAQLASLSAFCTGLVGGEDGEGRRWAHSCRSVAIG